MNLDRFSNKEGVQFRNSWMNLVNEWKLITGLDTEKGVMYYDTYAPGTIDEKTYHKADIYPAGLVITLVLGCFFAML